MAERKWKKISTWMAAWVMAVVFAVSGAQTAFAATSYVNSVSITLDVTPTVGESLPDLDVGYNSDNCEVSIPNNDKYDIVSAKWSSTKNDVKIGGTYTMKVTLKTLNNYRFSSSSYTSSKVKVKNGTFVSASRTSSDRLVVTVQSPEAPISDSRNGRPLRTRPTRCTSTAAARTSTRAARSTPAAVISFRI